MEKTQIWHLTMAILCMAAAVVMQPTNGPSSSAQQIPLMDDTIQGASANIQQDPLTEDTKQYVTNLCETFSSTFKRMPSTRQKQYAVLTLDQIPMPVISDNRLTNGWNRRGFLTGPNWIAAYIEKRRASDRSHMERILLNNINVIFSSFAQNKRRLPKNIYLYTYLFPCTGCANDIKNYVEKGIWQTIESNGFGRKTWNQVKQMNFWVVWSNQIHQEHYENTMNIFNSLNSLRDGPKFKFLSLDNINECKIPDY